MARIEDLNELIGREEPAALAEEQLEKGLGLPLAPSLRINASISSPDLK
jgi:hypothetical protein